MKNLLEKSGSVGALIAAAACPVCFPKLAILGALFGFGALAPFETAFFYGSQIFMLLALIGHTLSYQNHRNWKLLSLTVISVILFFVSLYVAVSETLSYLALAGVVSSTIWLIVENRRCLTCTNADL